MKQILMCMAGGVICLLIFVAMLSVDSRSVREKEMQESLSAAVDEAVEEIHVIRMDRYLGEEEWIALFEELLISRLSVQGDADSGEGDPGFSLRVSVAGADEKKGLLSVRVEESFTYPNGSTGTVTEETTMVIEQEAAPPMTTVSYWEEVPSAGEEEETDPTVEPRLVRRYRLESGSPCFAPEEEGTWLVTASSDSTRIAENATLVARGGRLYADDGTMVMIARPEEPGAYRITGMLSLMRMESEE